MKATLGQGLYSFSEASKLTGLRPARIREWFRGRSGGAIRKPVFLGDYAPVGGDYALSFHDLIDVFVAGQLRNHGVSLQTLRRVYHRMQADLQSPHPFCRRELLTDGKIVFVKGLDDAGREELTEILTRQRVFPEVLLPFLRAIDYDKITILAKRWRIAKMVVLDPTICFGKPIVESVGMATTLLAAAFHANGRDAELVADWYGINSSHVFAAVEFESDQAA